MTLVELGLDDTEYVLSGLKPDRTYEICVEYETTSTTFYPVKICDEVRTTSVEVAKEEKDMMIYIIIGAAVGGALIIIVVIVVVCIICRKRRNRQKGKQYGQRQDPEGRSVSGYLNGNVNNAYSSIEHIDRLDDINKHRDKSKQNARETKSESKSDLISNQTDRSAPASPTTNSATRYKHPDVREIESVFMRSHLEHLDEVISEAETDDEVEDERKPKFKTIKRANAAQIAAAIWDH